MLARLVSLTVVLASTVAIVRAAIVDATAYSQTAMGSRDRQVSSSQSERAISNDNRHAAGRVVDGVLTLNLEARAVDWFPEDSTGPAVPVYAFAEAGKPAMVPAPMIRVPVGTQLRVTLKNTLPHPLKVRGLYQRAAAVLDSIVVAPGATHVAQFVADVPGTFYYWGRTETVPPAGLPGRGRDASMFGAFIIDPRGAPPRSDERILVITMWNDSSASLGLKSEYAHDVLRREGVQRNFWLLFAVNGRSWPHTERLSYAAGDSVRWRVINGANFPHPMHLHGFHFNVEARGGPLRDTVFTAGQRRTVVTEWLTAGQTMTLSWHAVRAGNWLFHCHFVTHISDANAATTRVASAEHGNHAEQGMAGLVMGVHVRPSAAPTPAREAVPSRRLRLFVTERPNVFGTLPAYSYVLQEGASPPARDSVLGAGSTLVLRQNELTEITVRNFAKHATSIHWHGIELESFFDGVGDWSGWGTRTAPMIAPEDSFVVRIRPPRAGTFIYHTHAAEGVALASGLYGALIVLPQGETADTAGTVVLLSWGGPHDDARPLVNGTTAPGPVTMRAGVPHRFRIINISPLESPTIQLTLSDSIQQWRAVAKDGADLPAQQATLRRASIVVHPGETYDFEVVRARADSLSLTVVSIPSLADRAAARARGELVAQLPRILTHVPVIVRP
jgi:FtsP/CotA-like multicopper oxidase with cupredoxin domain